MHFSEFLWMPTSGCIRGQSQNCAEHHRCTDSQRTRCIVQPFSCLTDHAIIPADLFSVVRTREGQHRGSCGKMPRTATAMFVALSSPNTLTGTRSSSERSSISSYHDESVREDACKQSDKLLTPSQYTSRITDTKDIHTSKVGILDPESEAMTVPNIDDAMFTTLHAARASRGRYNPASSGAPQQNHLCASAAPTHAPLNALARMPSPAKAVMFNTSLNRSISYSPYAPIASQVHGSIQRLDEKSFHTFLEETRRALLADENMQPQDAPEPPSRRQFTPAAAVETNISYSNLNIAQSRSSRQNHLLQQDTGSSRGSENAATRQSTTQRDSAHVELDSHSSFVLKNPHFLSEAQVSSKRDLSTPIRGREHALRRTRETHPRRQQNQPYGAMYGPINLTQVHEYQDLAHRVITNSRSPEAIFIPLSQFREVPQLRTTFAPPNATSSECVSLAHDFLEKWNNLDTPRKLPA